MKCSACNGFGYIDNFEGDGLTCPKCGGTGNINYIQCPMCDGFGQINSQTNEEWFCNLDTEDKAREISDMTAQGYWSEELVEKWLKEIHK